MDPNNLHGPVVGIVTQVWRVFFFFNFSLFIQHVIGAVRANGGRTDRFIKFVFSPVSYPRTTRVHTS